MLCDLPSTLSNKGLIQHIEKDGVMLCSGDFVPCDVVVGCIGFERSNFLCESLTGRCEVKTTNYLDQHMMYLADAEIDEGDEMRQEMTRDKPKRLKQGWNMMEFILRSLVSNEVKCFNYCRIFCWCRVWRPFSLSPPSLSLSFFFVTLSLSLCHPLSLSLCLSLSLFLSFSLSFSLSLFLSFFRSFVLSFFFSFFLCFYLSFFLSSH